MPPQNRGRGKAATSAAPAVSSSNGSADKKPQQAAAAALRALPRGVVPPDAATCSVSHSTPNGHAGWGHLTGVHASSGAASGEATHPGWLGEGPGTPANAPLQQPHSARTHAPPSAHHGSHGGGSGGAANGGAGEHGHGGAGGEGGGKGVRDELGSMALLVLLYMVQGVPLGLTTGALPFMLSSKVSYTDMGIFGLAAYPYSLKLLWSPIVDSVYSRRVGRRKSWIVPIQLLTAWMLIAFADRIQVLYEAADVVNLTSLFFVFVFLMATQDIAVDGWALTLLSPANVSYASTCQTVGQTTGIFTSFTVFLALQDAGFCNKYLRGSSWLAGLVDPTPSSVGVVTLSGYMRFWGWVFAAVTLLIAVCVREAPEEGDGEGGEAGAEREAAANAGQCAAERGRAEQEEPGKAQRSAKAAGRKRGGLVPLTQDELNLLHDQHPPAGAGGGGAGAGQGLGGRRGVWAELVDAYVQLLRVLRLPAVWRLTALLLTYRVGVLAAEGAAHMKLIDKGVAKEALAFMVLFQFPVELLSAVVAGRWAATSSPYPPFITGYMLRLVTAGATVYLTAWFPAGATSFAGHGQAFAALAGVSLASSFVSYLSFTALGSFFNRVSDPEMGGAYLTLLNTIANIGYLMPRSPLFWAMDVLTVARCSGPDGGAGAGPAGHPEGTPWAALACPKKLSEMLKPSVECVAAGGTCALASDGYYMVSCVSLAAGAVAGLVYVGFVRRMVTLPLSSWRPAKVEQAKRVQ